ncbi:MAG: phosphate uptake regulator PhoU [Verrucomicrobia bacterium]|nr:phosphate uptake regulator PhoU [Verrucomicrobiota bacterium]
MFRELIDAWRRKPILVQMCEGLVRMIRDAQWMFRSVTASLLEHDGADATTGQAIYERDIKINKAERHIRKQLVEHLAILPGSEVPTCLVLMSVIKDAERIGDYCKNILEIARVLDGPLGTGPYADEFRALIGELGEAFEPVAKSFEESDRELGHTVVSTTRTLAKRAEAIIDRLLEEDPPNRHAVAYALLARFLKRVSAHLANIATSTVMPLHKLDFFDEKWEKKELRRP